MDTIDSTDRLSLPLIAGAQAQKHVTHNEALLALDALVQLTLQSRTRAEPPLDPRSGDAWLVAPDPLDAWGGRTGEVAVAFDGGWRFHPARTGLRAWCVEEAAFLVFDGTDWVSTGTGGGEAAFERLGVGTNADGTNALSVKGAASLFTHDGTDHRMVVNRAAKADTASLLLQSGYSGRAEIGLTGSDDVSLKTSPDGSAWHTALRARAGDGAVAFPSGTHPDLPLPATPQTGGADWALGPPNVLTTSSSRVNLAMLARRLYMCAFHVDRPTLVSGLVCAQHGAASAPDAVLRAGIYELGAPASPGWTPGPLVADLGTLPAGTAGIRDFSAGETPIPLAPGWYLGAIGCSDTGADLRCPLWNTPGTLQYFEHGSGAGSDLRVAGASSFLYVNNMQEAIRDGLPSTWGTGAAVDFKAVNTSVYQMVVPRWRRAAS